MLSWRELPAQQDYTDKTFAGTQPALSFYFYILVPPLLTPRHTDNSGSLSTLSAAPAGARMH